MDIDYKKEATDWIKDFVNRMNWSLPEPIVQNLPDADPPQLHVDLFICDTWYSVGMLHEDWSAESRKKTEEIFIRAYGFAHLRCNELA